MRRVLAGAALCALGVLAVPGVAAAQTTTTTPVEADPPLTAPIDPADPSTTPDPGGSPTTVVGGGRTSVANVTFSLDLGATTIVGDPTAGQSARGTIRFNQDVQGPGKSLSGIIAQVRCASVTGKRATVVGQVTRGTGVFHNTQSITLFIEDNGQPVLGRPPVDRFGSTVSDADVPPTCLPAGAGTPVDLGVSISEGDFVVSTSAPSTTPAPESTTTPGASDTPDTSTPAGGGAVSGP